MSFRGRGGSGPFGGRGGSFRGRGDSRGGRGGFQNSYGPPATVVEMGEFKHACEGQIVCTSTNEKIPYFNAPMFLENKTAIGKVDEIFGPLTGMMYTIQPQEGIVATSFKTGDKFYIGSDRLLPIERFLPKPKPLAGAKKPKRAGGAMRGGPTRGGPRGRGGMSRGAPRGAPRGRGDRGGRGGGGFNRGGGGFQPRGRGPPRGRF